MFRRIARFEFRTRSLEIGNDMAPSGHQYGTDDIYEPLPAIKLAMEVRGLKVA